MAAACLRSALLLNKSIRIKDAVLRVALYQPICNQASATSQLIVVRHGSFFIKHTADQIWDSATSVSNAGRKRGRASRGKLVRRVNLNIGQKMGHGSTGLFFPGLSTSFSGKEKFNDLGVRKIQRKEDDSVGQEESRIQKRKGGMKIDPLDRGYSGSRLPGRKIDPPDPIDGYDFKDFDTYVIESKLVASVTASQGTVTSSYIIVATGNRKGLFGIAVGRGSTTQAALRVARNKAAQQLVYIDKYNNHTPLHNFAEKYHKTSVIVYQAPTGHGLRCHHVLKIICKLIGIKDIYVKSEGNVRNYLNLTRAFMSGLLKTKSHQDISNELGHHIVEYRVERDNYPFLVASPTEEAKETNFEKEDGFEFDTYCFNNRLPYVKGPKKPHYWKSEPYIRKLRKDYKQRNQPRAKIERSVQGFGEDFKILYKD